MSVDQFQELLDAARDHNLHIALLHTPKDRNFFNRLTVNGTDVISSYAALALDVT